MNREKPLFRKTPDQQAALRLLGGRSGHVLLFGGSRSGKTFIMVYAIIVRALRAPGSRHMILRYRGNSVIQSVRLDTFEKVRSLAFPRLRCRENRTERFLTLPNGSEIWFGGLDNDERADRILGREFCTIYFNECSEIQYSAVNTALTRLAQKTDLSCRAYYDCNPPGKRHWTYELFVAGLDPMTRAALAKPENYASMLMNPAGNSENLPDGYLENTLGGLSERQKQRFLLGKWLDDVEGALWKREDIDRSRVLRPPAGIVRTVIGVDPAVTGGAGADSTGIICVALGSDGFYYVLADRSRKGSVMNWVEAVADTYEEFAADRVVCEVNNGGDLLESVLRRASPLLSYRAVRAASGKFPRAEPVAALYEQGRVRHVGLFPELEDEMCSYNPLKSARSPDRMDALVWALTELSGSPDEKRWITV